MGTAVLHAHQVSHSCPQLPPYSHCAPNPHSCSALVVRRCSGTESGIHAVAADIAECAATVVPETTPFEGMDVRIIGAVGGTGALPDVPRGAPGNLSKWIGCFSISGCA